MSDNRALRLPVEQLFDAATQALVPRCAVVGVLVRIKPSLQSILVCDVHAWNFHAAPFALAVDATVLT
jgi:hypothetical protein